ncbi:hypothetical protein L873DRAFT_185514 [Choiromyces venosus 120613-1]|uniref:Uncharacterized protein n=1 Tax=Choiromyces venosus 120613-1 TaxID=1336337 RepID=A0A3N4J7X4_9PEZI|nr:hypothetical protein L873DRAFT_185514 [Choiromyces venosus 120613-1]
MAQITIKIPINKRTLARVIHTAAYPPRKASMQKPDGTHSLIHSIMVNNTRIVSKYMRKNPIYR